MRGREKRWPKIGNQEPGHDKQFGLNPVHNWGGGGPEAYIRQENDMIRFPFRK